jgi:hypothetical protein
VPDGKTASIAPGGTLALALAGEPYFYNGPGADVEVYGVEGDRAAYTIFVRDDAEGKWIHFDVNRRGFPHGMAAHDMGHHGIQRATQIMIKNDAFTALSVDAVTPLHRQPSPSEASHTAGHDHRE